MRKTQTIQIVGIGNFNIYPIVENDKEYNKVNSAGNILKKVKVVEGIPAKYSYFDDSNKEYLPQEVFTEFQGLKIQACSANFFQQQAEIRLYDKIKSQ